MSSITSERIKKAIEKSGLTLVELEKKTGIPKSAIQRYASGNTEKLPIDRVKLIAEHTGVTPEYIMGWDSNVDLLHNEQLGNYDDNIKYLADKPELLAKYQKIDSNPTLSLLFDKASELTPQQLETILQVINMIDKEQGME